MEKVCPECGGVLNGDRCQFCGAVIIDMAVIDLDKPFFLKFKKDNMVHRAKVRISDFRFELYSDVDTLYYDNNPFTYLHVTPPTVSMEFTVVPTNNIWAIGVDTNIAGKEDIREGYNMMEDD